MPLKSRPGPRGLIRALLLVLAVAGVSHAAVHLALVKSEPAAAAVLNRSPRSVTLWFSQRPNVKLTRVVVLRASDTLQTGTAVVVDTAGKQIRVDIATSLSAGKYDVNWRTLARDGHAVSGKFAFTVSKNAVQSGSSSTAPAPSLGTYATSQ